MEESPIIHIHSYKSLYLKIIADISVKMRSLDAAFKLEVVQYAEKNTNAGAATKYSWKEKQVRHWKIKKI